jgi:hypothetical protein
MEFRALLIQIYGQPSAEGDAEDSKKKRPDTSVYDVALSYASEQWPFVSEVEERLRGEGVRVFCDALEKYSLWGRNLAEHFEWVFSERARFCIMFISKEYVEKPWPTHERRAAISRQIRQGGEYILPIRFDSTVVPGLDPGIKYLTASDETPKSVADGFIKGHMG